jgi:hypothetical protein
MVEKKSSDWKKMSDWSESFSMRIDMRASPEFLKLIDDWRRMQDDLPSRTVAIRRLVELGVASGKSKAGKAKVK